MKITKVKTMATIKKLDKKEYSKARLDAEAEKKTTVSPVKPIKEAKKAKKGLSIEETKLGVTLVISKETCYMLGFKETDSTKDVISYVKEKIGLK